MKLIYFISIFFIFSCGKNLIGEEDNEFKPSNLIYQPDSILFDTSITSTITSVKPHINKGSGNVVFEILSPVIGAIQIDHDTGIISARSTLEKKVYYVDVSVRNYVGSTTFNKAFIIDVK